MHPIQLLPQSFTIIDPSADFEPMSPQWKYIYSFIQKLLRIISEYKNEFFDELNFKKENRKNEII